MGLTGVKLKGLVLVLLGGLLLTSCGGSQQSQVAAGNLQGVFHMGNGTEPQGLDPHIVTGLPEHHIIQALFEGLVTKNPTTLEIEPAVAESWDISADGRLYTFHLRHDARWSNGDPLTAEDFRWSWQRALTPALGSLYNYMYFGIVNAEAFGTGQITDFSQVGVKVLDDYTLQVELKEPTPYFLQILDHYSTFPVHRATLEAFGSASSRLSQWARAGNLVSNGPFVLSEWQVNSHIRVEKSPYYWDADKVKLNAIVYYPTENLTTEERMFRDGQLHFTNSVPLEKIPTYLKEQPELIEIAPYLGTYYYMINTTRPPFDDARVRRALAMAVDRKLLVETVLQGIVEPAYAIVPPGTLGYDPPKLFSYDPEQARELLAAAGYPEGQGFPAFDILYNTQESHQKIAVAIQQMWRQNLGIDVGLVNQEWQVYLDSQENMNYDISRRGWIGDYVDPNSFLDMFLTGGGNNKTGFSNPRYDQIILQDAPKVQDRDQRYALFREAETLLIDNMPIIPLYTYQSSHLKQPSVKGMPTNIMDYYNWKYVYLDAQE
ncbi:MAG: peptide ABC transporter substrate-binding protein [Pseudomonadales bacterium]|nr:peptide ABC transporter substrate-binding protein [Pseudomonadales bacterium]